MKKNYILPILTLFLIVATTTQLPATNGFKSIASGYRVGTAGAGSAMPMDATDPAVNPALIAFIPNQFFIAGGIFSPHRFMDTSGATASPLPGAPQIGNPAGHSNSGTKIFPDGSLGLRFGCDCSQWAFGLTLFGNGGMNTNYDKSRINPFYLNNQNYDRSIYYRILNLAPTIAFNSCDNTFSIGVSPIFSYSDFKTTSATLPNFAETTGRNRWDHVWGIGGRFGVFARINCMWSFAFSAQMPTFYQRFDKYRDVLISHFNTPANFVAGLAFSPCPCSTFLFDYEFIYHTGTKLLRVNPGEGGFGWKNMNIFKFAYIQEFDCLTFRLGYSYGRSPIRRNTVFANVLAPAIVEHHIAAGISYAIDPCNILTLSGYYVPRKTLTDDGSGDQFSQLGKGAKIGMWQYDIQLAYQYNF